MARTWKQARRPLKLSSSVTVGEYEAFVTAHDTRAIADFIEERLRERYVEPVESSLKPHGFAMMATSCLLIETLSCFRTGEGETGSILKEPNGKPRYGSRYFHDFFTATEGFEPFGEPHQGTSEELAREFYSGVRCGILHQGETTAGWRIRRVGRLFHEEERTINAATFLHRVDVAISLYAGELRRTAWNTEVWNAFRRKMKHTIEQTRLAADDLAAEA